MWSFGRGLLREIVGWDGKPNVYSWDFLAQEWRSLYQDLRIGKDELLSRLAANAK